MTRATDINKEVRQLVNLWQPRKAAFSEWYQMIRLYNNLAQDKMESVISTDPRTGFDMAAWLLTPQTGTFVADPEGLDMEERQDVAAIEAYCNFQLLRANRLTRGTLFGTFTDRLVRLGLATGWFSIFCLPTKDGWSLAAWNPATVFPDYNGDGSLARVARRYTVSKSELVRKHNLEGWRVDPSNLPGRNVLISHLYEQAHGGVQHSVVLNSNILVRDELLTELSRIPVYVGPVAGLPDDGSITTSEQWRSEVGQSVIAPVKDMTENYNRMLTYMQQILRDTANPKYVERVRGASVLTPEKLYERGAIFSIEPDESIDTVPLPPLPAEMRAHQFDLRGNLQRGLFSDITFGSITQQVSALLMSQVTAAAKRVLYPFHQGLTNVLGLMATETICLMRELKMPLGKNPFPRLREEPFISYRYDIQVPGDFVHRATVGRMLNPQFRLSGTTVTDVLFPEVTNILEEQGRLQSEDALANPVFRQLILVREMRRIAVDSAELGDTEFTTLLNRAADEIARTLGGGGEPTAPTQGGDTTSSLPPEVQALLRG